MMNELLRFVLGAVAGCCITLAYFAWKARVPLDQEIVRRLRERGVL